ncbi:MAG: methyltransferase domain-containing protein [Phycisphaerae bacterium]|nr:methyltransferase domain-containing protein [Phycisphaerae bacterium]
MKKLFSLMLAFFVFFAGCAERESTPVPVIVSVDEDESLTAPEVAVSGAGEKQEVIEEVEKVAKEPDVIYVPTPNDVVAKMLELANVQKDDLLYDLGCGDGRIVVTAAKRFGCKAVGYDIDPQRIKESLDNVAVNNVGHLVTIEQKDIFTLDLGKANVITLYLLPSLNVKLIPQLKKLKPGSRIVSHDFRMKGVKPDKIVELTSSEDNAQHKVFLWTAPIKKRNKMKQAGDDVVSQAKFESTPVAIGGLSSP